MKIIDAHLHLFPMEETYGNTYAHSVGHENNIPYLRSLFGDIGIVKGVVMGNRKLSSEYHQYPTDLFSYCIGLDTHAIRGGLTPKRIDKIEENLRREDCCGIKLYPGYIKMWLTDSMYTPIYELAETYQKPVAVHTGLTAHPKGHLKYSHPLVLDEVASDFRRTKFVMCHFGNPFLQEAMAVLVKNPNVSTDLSGLVEGQFHVMDYIKEYHGFVSQMQAALVYGGCWDRIMFGTDFPIVNYMDCIQFIRQLVPEIHWEKVFFDNANYIYKLGC